jgi:hypothetical protein
MSQENKHSFTAENLIRYHRGELSPKEMHQLEKAALEDAFLAEALEGYALFADKTLPIPSIHVKPSSHDHLTSNGPKVIPFGQRFKYVIAVAASLILAYTVYFQLTNNNEKDKTDLAQKQNNSPAVVDLLRDSNQSQPPINPVNSISSGVIPSESVKKPTKRLNESTTPPINSSTQEDVPDASPLIVSNEKIVVNDKEISELPHSQIRQPVTTTEGGVIQPNVAYSTLPQTELDLAVSTDEVVVSETAVSNTRKKTKSETKKATSVAQVAISSVEPVGGWQAYMNYLKQQHLGCKDNQGNTIKGIVKVQFIILPDGSVDRLEAFGALPDECKEMAKKTVQNGPRWQANTQTVQSIDIPFE